MTNNQRIIQVGFVIIILALGIVTLLILPISRCNSPVFVGYYEGDPVNIMQSVIHTLNGLPKSDTELSLEPSKMEATSIYPVTSWHIVRLQVEQTEGQSLLDDDPTYGLTVNLDVTYEDGTQAILQWSWWRYGVVRCPVVVNYGDGPLGTLKVLELNLPTNPQVLGE